MSVTEANKQVQRLLNKYKSVSDTSLGTLIGVKAQLILEDGAQPKFCRARNVPYAVKPYFEKELVRLQEEGIISPIEYSPWASGVVPVAKRDTKDVRLCGDYKVTINPVIREDKFPLPRVEDIFVKMAGGKRFSKIDLKNAYLQMEVEETSKQYITINTHKGLFRYNRLPFGIKTAPSIWQRAMGQTLQGIPNVEVMLDDIIVTGKSDAAHLENLEAVLKRLAEKNLRINVQKCRFFMERIEYCGHEIDKYGLHKTNAKIEAVQNAPRPQDVSSVRGFIGLINYYHRFLPNLSSVLHPLNQLLEKDHTWEWSRECEDAFKEAKRLVTSEQVLAHYDPDLPVRVACDASPYGLGAVLSHVMSDGSEKPVAFASRTLNRAERNYSQIDKEALALVWGIRKFNHYLYGRRFTLVTDHQPLTAIFHPEKGIPAMTAARMQRYALQLAAHDYEIKYRTSAKHGNADGLSRVPMPTGKTVQEYDVMDVFYMNHMDVLPITASVIQNECSKDPILSKVLERTQHGWPQVSPVGLEPFFSKRHELSIFHGCIMWGIRVVVPHKLRNQILHELHEGHIGIVKMKGLARSYVWWPGIDQDIESLAKKCQGCQKVQFEAPTVPLHPWEWPIKPWQRAHTCRLCWALHGAYVPNHCGRTQ